MLVYNADILTDIDLRQMVKAHQTSKADVTLLVSASRNSSRKLLFDNDGHMCGWTNTTTGEVRPASAAPINAMAFGGIHLLSAHALRALCAYSDSRNGVFPVMDFYIDNCQALHINAWEPEAGSIWIDIGRPETWHKHKPYSHPQTTRHPLIQLLISMAKEMTIQNGMLYKD